MGNVIKSLIQPLEKAFYWRDEVQAREAKADMLREFAGFSNTTLAAAARRIRVHREFSTMPTVGEIGKVLRSLSPKTALPEHRPFEDHPEHSQEAIRIADELIESPLGKRAAREGWIVSLQDFCRKLRRLPKEHEIDTLVQVSRDAEAILRLAPALLDRRRKLAARVLGDVEDLRHAQSKTPQNIEPRHEPAGPLKPVLEKIKRDLAARANQLGRPRRHEELAYIGRGAPARARRSGER